MPFRCDLTSSEDIESDVAQTKKEFQRIDILVNNSGRTWGASPEDIKVEDWKTVIDVNLTGTFMFCEKAGKEMIKRKRGKLSTYYLTWVLEVPMPRCLMEYVTTLRNVV